MQGFLFLHCYIPSTENSAWQIVNVFSECAYGRNKECLIENEEGKIQGGPLKGGDL